MGWGSKPKDDPKTPHLVKTDFWGRTTYCDPKTGKPLKNQGKPKDEGLKKPGWV
jgi:hypothetical protein